MRLPRLRFTLRTLIALVAVVAATLGGFLEYRRLMRKAAEYRARAADHAGIEQTLRTIIEKSGPNSPVDISPGNGLRSKRFTAQAVADHEAALRLKYERAAGYPWLPVEPDPPEPVPPS
jgi:hypothetical protein